MRSSVSTPAASRSRPTSRAAFRPSRSSGSPTAPARRRRSACGAESPRRSSNGRCGGSRSISLPRACGRRGPGSISRSRCRSSPPRGRSRASASPSMPPSASSRLDGRLRPVGGVLALAEAARRAGLPRILCPARSAPEAALAGIEPVPVRHLADAAAYLRGEREPEPWVEGNGHPPEEPQPDLADVRGQERARRALEIAATGGHNLLLAGPPGTGKTMLARRLPAILPPLSTPEALEVTRIHSVAGMLSAGPPADHVPGRCGRRTTTLRSPRWSAAAPGRGRARSASRTGACSSWTSSPSSSGLRSRRSASRSRTASSASRASEGGRPFRPGSSSLRR